MLATELAERRKDIKVLRQQNKPWKNIETWELFLDGEDCQFRMPPKPYLTDDEVKAWSFPRRALHGRGTADHLCQRGHYFAIVQIVPRYATLGRC